jgi:hypothetical protein
MPQQGPDGKSEFEASLEPFAGALKTESCRVCFGLAHFGQAIFVPFDSTICSYRAPQSLQTYSYMGISFLAPNIVG